VDIGTQPTGTQPIGTQIIDTQTISTHSTGMLKEDWEKLYRSARSTTRLCLADSVLLNVSG
jgi:hypothetical protein